MKFQWVIWDWNGTLADDAQVFCGILNRMLSARELPPITFDQYRRIYDHPAILIYERAGFDIAAESFDLIAAEFCKIYVDATAAVELQPDARYALERFQAAGMRQALLSALPEWLLAPAIEQHRLGHYFTAVLGLEDSHGRSKIELGRRLLAEFAIVPEQAVLIGDSLHDFETAQALGLHCCLVGRGLQHPERLAERGCPVYSSFDEIIARLTDSPLL